MEILQRPILQFNKRIQGQNGEEVMAITSEMMMDGDIKLADTPLKKMKNFFNGFAYSRADREIKFDTNNRQTAKERFDSKIPQ